MNGVGERLAARGYRVPGGGEPLRVAFTGHRQRFLLRSLERAEGFKAEFVDPDAPGARAGIEAFAPHAVVAFVCERFDPELVKGLGALTIGWIADPVPRPSPGDAWPDQEGVLRQIAAYDMRAYDRVVVSDPLAAGAATAWRSVQLPVADSVFTPRVVAHDQAKPLSLVSVPYGRNWILEVSRRRQGLIRAEEVEPEQLRQLLREATIGVNVHVQPALLLEESVPFHLAAGHLLVSEPLGPAARGIVPDFDFLEVSNLEEIETAVWSIQQWPEAHMAMRVRGRLKAELFRASRVYPRLIGDALRDVAAFG